ELVPVRESLQPRPLPYCQDSGLFEVYVIIRQRSGRYIGTLRTPRFREYSLSELFGGLIPTTIDHRLELFEYGGSVLAVVMLRDNGSCACYGQTILRCCASAL